MLVRKNRENGTSILLEYEPVKKYSAGYILYNVYKITANGRRIYLYKETLNELELRKIFDNNNMEIVEE